MYLSNIWMFSENGLNLKILVCKKQRIILFEKHFSNKYRNHIFCFAALKRSNSRLQLRYIKYFPDCVKREFMAPCCLGCVTHDLVWFLRKIFSFFRKKIVKFFVFWNFCLVDSCMASSYIENLISSSRKYYIVLYCLCNYNQEIMLIIYDVLWLPRIIQDVVWNQTFC